MLPIKRIFVSKRTVVIKVHGDKEDEGQKKVEGEEKDEWTPPVADAGGPGKGGDRSKGRDQSKPNVFFIMIDDMGWNDIGYQSIDLKGVTPNLDKLAAGGVKVTIDKISRLTAWSCWLLIT